MTPTQRFERYRAWAERIGRGHDAPNAEQEALIGLWRACENFNASRGEFEPYARKCIAMQYRVRRVRGPEVESNKAFEVETYANGTRTPDEIAASNERAQDILSTVKDVRLRGILKMRVIDGAGWKEIAARYHITIEMAEGFYQDAVDMAREGGT